ncbi:hypothetical protein PARU111607_04595 [Palleronia rufa]
MPTSWAGPATVCKPKAGHGGVDLSRAATLKAPADEDAELTRPPADATLDNVAPTDPPGES